VLLAHRRAVVTSPGWTDIDFERLSWHDCHVHAVRVVAGGSGAGELEFDLDFIAEWRCDDQGASFVLLPSLLRFREVTSLRMSLDWLGATAALGPFSLDRIERRRDSRERYVATLWRLVVNWPAGDIEFEAAGFTQQPWGRAVVSRQQVLAAAERVAA
jgi:hypothetical protein